MGCVCSNRSHESSSAEPELERSTPESSNNRFPQIADKCDSLSEVQDALRSAGLGSAELIFALDLSKANEWSSIGFDPELTLHDFKDGTNPYKSTMSVIGRALQPPHPDQFNIYMYGFGCAASKDQHVVGLDQPFQDVKMTIDMYERFVPNIAMSGPVDFAPSIYTAIRGVERSGGKFHVLVLLCAASEVGQAADGDFLTSTVEAIKVASNYALSIVMIGLGDGPWDNMEQLNRCSRLPERRFDNFHFVDLSDYFEGGVNDDKSREAKLQALLALKALNQVPTQYKAAQELGLVGSKRGLDKVPCIEMLHPHSAAGPIAMSHYADGPVGRPLS